MCKKPVVDAHTIELFDKIKFCKIMNPTEKTLHSRDKSFKGSL